MYELLVVAIIVIAYIFIKSNSSSSIQTKIGTDYLPDTFVVFDLETTGLNSSTHEIIEIAAIKHRKGSYEHATFQSLIKPKKKIPKKITEITGITDDMVRQVGRELEEVLKEFIDFIEDHHLVSYNAEFDVAFLEKALEDHGMKKCRNSVSCALKMARRAWKNLESYRLVDLAKKAGIKQGKAHRALEDARRTAIIYAAAVDRLKTIY